MIKTTLKKWLAKFQPRSFFKRGLFHLSALVIGGLFVMHSEYAFSKLALFYLSMLLIFPRKIRALPLTLALLTSLIASFWIILSGNWLLPLAWGAWQSALLYILVIPNHYQQKLSNIVLACVIAFIYHHLNFSPYYSFGFMVVFSILTLIGFALGKAFVRMEDSASDASQSHPNPSKLTQTLYHEKAIRELSLLSHQLPDNLSAPIQNICQQATLILEHMNSDPRDWASGERFLSQYINAAYNIATQNKKLLNSGQSAAQSSQVIEHSHSLLQRLDHAFNQQRLQMFENDADDLTVELKVLDKILKMEGYK